MSAPNVIVNLVRTHASASSRRSVSQSGDFFFVDVLFDDVEAGAALDDSLHVRNLMAGNHEEVRGVVANARVVAGGDFEGVMTISLPAFADDLKRRELVWL